MSRLFGGRREPGSAPHLVLAAATPDTVLTDLVANLGLRAGAEAAALLAEPTPPTVGVAAGAAADTGTGERPAALVEWPGPASAVPPDRTLSAPVLDGPTRRGLLTLTLPDGGTATAAHRTLLSETAACVAVALRGERLRTRAAAATADAERLDAELRAAREQLALVREAERRRLVAAIVTATAGQLDGLRATVRELADGDPVALGRLRERLADLIASFRAVVRGVHPTVLREHGPLAALEELAIELPRQVRFDGRLVRRVGWEVESGFYHGVAAVLQVFAASGQRHPLRVVLAHEGGVLTALVHDRPAPRTWIGRVRDALALDSDRIAALGGALRPEVSDDGVIVRVTLPERFGQVDPLPGKASDADATLLGRLRGLAAEGARVDRPRAAAWSAVAARLDEPPRVAVTGQHAATLLDALVGAEVRGTVPAGVATWLTAGPVPLVASWPRGGGRPDRAPLAMARLPATAAELAGVERFVVQWPSTVLRDLTLVDPAGATPAELAATVDAVVHVFSLEPADAEFTRALRGAVLVIGVASTEEAERVARSHCDLTVRLDPRLALLAGTLRVAEFQALRALARGEESVGPQRFPSAAAALAVDALRAGTVDTPAGLARLLGAAAGLPGLTAALDRHLARDGDLVVARRALRSMVALSRHAPVELAREVERLAVTAREPAEFDVLDALRHGTLVLPDTDAATRLLGDHGRGPRDRLGLPSDATVADLVAAATTAVRTWQRNAAARAAGTREHDACLVLLATATALTAAQP